MTASALPVSHAPSLRRASIAALLALAFIGYFVVLHVLIVERAAPRVTLAMVLAPWAIAALSRRRLRLVGAVALVTFGIVASFFAEGLALRVDTLLLIENVAFLSSLAALFAWTLRPGHDALISMLARKVRGDTLPPSVLHYTRRATAAWALFFLACACVSLALHAWAPLWWWSLFVNILIWPSIAAMFAMEYAVRLRMLPDVEHVPLAAGWRAYTRRDDPADAATGDGQVSR